MAFLVNCDIYISRPTVFYTGWVKKVKGFLYSSLLPCFSFIFAIFVYSQSFSLNDVVLVSWCKQVLFLCEYIAILSWWLD